MDVDNDTPAWGDWWDKNLEITTKIDRATALRLRHAPFLLTAREPQRPPPSKWRTWLFMGGRGAGKTRAGAEWTRFAARFGGYGFRHFILHYARLAVQAGGVDAFLIGSEMVGLTRIRDHEGRFPFVEALVELAGEVREIVGPEVQISYAADWTEYGAFAPSDGSNDVLFPLDTLWASDAIDFVGVDWYAPMSDWRDGDAHLDRVAGFEKIEEDAYLSANLAGGEAYDWYYASDADRAAQTRTPIEDLAHGEHWVFRQKDLANWWSQSHHERAGGIRLPQATSWVPGSKPIRIIELGIPAIDKGTNAPNLFYDPKSSESALPHFSSGGRDDLIQRRALAVANAYWRAQPMVEQVLNWAWDGRPWPDYPSREDVWGDGPNWQYGHWLNGRASLIDLSEVVGDRTAFEPVGARPLGALGRKQRDRSLYAGRIPLICQRRCGSIWR